MGKNFYFLEDFERLYRRELLHLIFLIITFLI